MTPHPPAVSGTDVLGAVAVSVIFVAIASRLAEPTRRHFNAIFVAGAGAAYLSGGLGAWEFVFTAIATVVAYWGLRSHVFIGVAWLMHAAWDVMHHLYGQPIIAGVPTSSAGCAVADSLIAIWFLAGAPGVAPPPRAQPAGAR